MSEPIRPGFRSFAQERGPVFVPGAVLLALGVLLWRWASPSPHGYIEVFFALPLICIGAIALAVPAVVTPREVPRTVLVLGWLLLGAASLPLLSLLALCTGASL